MDKNPELLRQTKLWLTRRLHEQGELDEALYGAVSSLLRE